MAVGSSRDLEALERRERIASALRLIRTRQPLQPDERAQCLKRLELDGLPDRVEIEDGLTKRFLTPTNVLPEPWIRDMQASVSV